MDGVNFLVRKDGNIKGTWEQNKDNNVVNVK